MAGAVPGQPPAPGYPVTLPLAGRLAVVAGGGARAVREVAGLRAAGARVVVVAPALSPSLADLAARGLIEARRRPCQRSDLRDTWLVHACTGDPAADRAVAADAAELRVWCVLAEDAEDTAARPGAAPAAGAGRVCIAGGGPGDPGLITAAALARLQAADVVVTDRLAPAGLLAGLRPDVQIIDAAKVPGGPSMRQEAINAALVEHARAGRAVVRLKGGDPFVFGRGLEEVEACRAAGVPVEVLPGVTSAVAVPAAAGIPVTHRGVSQGFTVVSGHVSPLDPRSTVNWAALARSGTTLVLLMAVEHLAAIAGTLTAAGLPAGTPAACVADGWTPHQQVVSAPLAGLAAAMTAARVTSPAVIVIGDTAARAQGGSPAAEPAARPPRRVLVLGGARSGKSAVAEGFLAGGDAVDYVATGAPPDAGDPEWAARVAGHRQRRPPQWRTIETLDLHQVLRDPGAAAPVLVDCLSTWLARVMDACGAWDGCEAAAGALATRVDDLVAAWRASTRAVVAVSSEVGSGVVPGTLSGRRFRDELGSLNARIAAECDEVWLCTAGVPRRLR
ncbi:MAG: uroporphyrinogen-III C-methyltransferase [Gemmatimonadota bacterium]